jgi:hypothetical protein
LAGAVCQWITTNIKDIATVTGMECINLYIPSMKKNKICNCITLYGEIVLAALKSPNVHGR